MLECGLLKIWSRKASTRANQGLVLIVMAFPFYVTSWSMLRVLIFLLASFPRLVRLFYLCSCLPFVCFSLVLFLLLIKVGFGFSLAPIWGHLNFDLRALICFIGTFKPSRMRLGRLFAYPLTELLKTQWMS